MNMAEMAQNEVEERKRGWKSILGDKLGCAIQ
jgi:hypothetical protein